jgi:protein ImuB
MPLAEATALAGYAAAGPPHLELHDPAADRAALEALAEWCQRYSPSVGLEEAEQPESLLLDVSGLGPLFGGEAALARRVVRQFQNRNLTARVTIADTLGAAWAVARFADLEATETARMTDTAVDTAPDRAGGASAGAAAILAAARVPLIVRPGETWAALAPLGVAALRLPEETCALLGELGLQRIEQVAGLSRSTLLARFGPRLLARLDQATGAAAEAIVARAVPPECEFSWLFEHPTGRRDMLEIALARLIARACGALAQQRRGVLRLRCRFEIERRPAEEFVVGLYRPSADARHVGELVHLKLESLRFREPVLAIRLTVLAADRLEYRQQEMFAERQAGREAPRELAALVDRLSNRLGAQAVLRPWLLAGAQPEFTCQYQPLASLAARRGNLPRRARGVSRKKPPAPLPPAERVAGDRPLHLQPRPLRLPVISIAPEGPPVQFRLAGRAHRVAHFWGPERIETGWWRSRCVRRDYYQVETGSGQRFWLFRELHSGAWFLHGVFA